MSIDIRLLLVFWLSYAVAAKSSTHHIKDVNYEKPVHRSKVDHHRKQDSFIQPLKNLERKVDNATRRDSLGFLKAFTDVLRQKIDSNLNIDLEGEKRKDYHFNEKTNHKKSKSPKPAKPAKKSKSKKKKQNVKKVEQKDASDDFDDDIDLNDNDDVEGSTSTKTQSANTTPNKQDNNQDESISADYDLPKQPAELNYEAPIDNSGTKIMKAKLATQKSEAASMAPNVPSDAESGSGSAEDVESGSGEKSTTNVPSIDQNKALNGQALPQVNPQQIQENTAQSSTPVSNFPVPPMIPIPLFYNSGQGVAGSGASGLGDVKATKDLANGIGESGDGEYAKPSGDWVSRILTKKKSKHKYQEEDEDDGFDEDDEQDKKEKWMVGNKNSQNTNLQKQQTPYQQQVQQQQQQKQQQNVGQVSQTSQASHTSSNYEYHYDQKDNSPPKTTYSYSSSSSHLPPYTDTYSYNYNNYIPPDYYHPQVSDPFGQAVKQDTAVSQAASSIPAAVTAQASTAQDLSNSWGVPQPAAVVPDASSFVNQQASTFDNMAAAAPASVSVAAPYVPDDNSYTTGECAAACPATCAPVCDSACCRGSIASPGEQAQQTSQWHNGQEDKGYNAVESKSGASEYKEDMQTKQQSQQAYPQLKTPPLDQIYPPPSSSLQTPKASKAPAKETTNTNFAQPKPYPTMYDQESLNPSASIPARDAVNDANIHPKENYPTDTENTEAIPYEDQESNAYDSKATSNAAASTSTNGAPNAASNTNVASNSAPSMTYNAVPNMASNAAPSVASNAASSVASNASPSMASNVAPNIAPNVVPNVLANVASNIAPNVAQDYNENAAANLKPQSYSMLPSVAQNYATPNIAESVLDAPETENTAPVVPDTKQAFQFNPVNPALANSDSNRNFAFQPVKPIMLKVPSININFNKNNNNKGGVRYPSPQCLASCQSKCYPYCSNECCGIDS